MRIDEVTEKTYEVWYRFRGETPIQAKKFVFKAANARAARKLAKEQLEGMYFGAAFGGWRITSVNEIKT